MKNKSSGNIWFFLILFVVFGSTGILPLVLIASVVFAIMAFSVKQSKAQDQLNRNNVRNTYSHGYTERTQGNVHTASDLAKINVYLRKYYRTHAQLNLPNDLQLVVRGDKYNTLSNLDVHRNGVRIGTINEFRSQYGAMYDQMFDTLLAMANNSTQYAQPNIVDAEYATPSSTSSASPRATVNKQEQPKNTTSEQPKERHVEKYMRQINDLNADIPDEEISNGLYEMAALLKQVDTLERKIPESTEKMKKMYEHYLPYMIQILEHYEHIQTLKSDVNYNKNVEQLRSTIRSINQALNNIIPSMSDSSFSDLSVDMATLEALLQKDGLTGGMDQPFYKG